MASGASVRSHCNPWLHLISGHPPMWTLKHVFAIVVLPVTVTIIIPAWVLWDTKSLNIGCSLLPPWNLLPTALAFGLVALGVVLVIRSTSLVATVGKGTLAPWMPTQHLVVRGIYRYVRNPMISGIFCILLGEAVLGGSIPLLWWFLIFVCINLLYIPMVEEPGLKKRFGEDYLAYRRHVPRWIPRRTPWEPGRE